MVFHFPPMSGGGSVVPAGIANTLANLGHEVTVVTPDVVWIGKRYEPPMNSHVSIIRVDTPASSNLKIAARLCKSNLQRKCVTLGKEKEFDFIFTIFIHFIWYQMQLFIALKSWAFQYSQRLMMQSIRDLLD